MTKQELANRLRELHDEYREAFSYSNSVDERLYHTTNMLTFVIVSLQLYLEGKIE